MAKQIGSKLYDEKPLGDGRLRRTYPTGQTEIVREIIILEDVATGVQAISLDGNPAAAAEKFAPDAQLRVMQEFLREEDVLALQEKRGRYDRKTRSVR